MTDPMSAPDPVTRVLAEHGPTGSVNSIEGWIECLCGDRLPAPTSLDALLDAEESLRRAHLAEALAPLLAEREAKARREVAADALEQAATQWGANHGVRQWLRAKARAVREGR